KDVAIYLSVGAQGPLPGLESGDEAGLPIQAVSDHPVIEAADVAFDSPLLPRGRQPFIMPAGIGDKSDVETIDDVLEEQGISVRSGLRRQTESIFGRNDGEPPPGARALLDACQQIAAGSFYGRAADRKILQGEAAAERHLSVVRTKREIDRGDEAHAR